MAGFIGFPPGADLGVGACLPFILTVGRFGLKGHFLVGSRLEQTT